MKQTPIRSRAAILIAWMGLWLGAATAVAQVTTPKQVYGFVVNPDGSTPVPSAIRFRAYLTVNPSQQLAETNLGCGIESVTGGTQYFVECGDFTNQWQSGMELTLQVQNPYNGGSKTSRFLLNSDPFQQQDVQLAAPPTIALQPQSVTNLAGSNASFSVLASGTAPLSYQWRFNGVSIAGATTNTYTRANVQTNDAGDYTVVITNVAGAVTSSVAKLTVLVRPFIVTQPQSVTCMAGTLASFSVQAGGTPPLSYQWRCNGTNLNGATAPVLSLTSVQPAKAGAYSVVVTNLAGAVTSAPPAMLNVVTFAATHSGAAYQSPGTCVVSCQVSHAVDRTLYFMVYQPELPAGWTLLSASGEGNAQVDSGQIVFNGAMPNPLHFTYKLNVPAGHTGAKSIAGDLLYYLSGMTSTAYLPATPDPLVVNYGALLSLRLQGTQAQLTLQGDAGRSYLIQTSTNLVNWNDVGSLITVGGLAQTNQPFADRAKFYRAKAQ